MDIHDQTQDLEYLDTQTNFYLRQGFDEILAAGYTRINSTYYMSMYYNLGQNDNVANFLYTFSLGLSLGCFYMFFFEKVYVLKLFYKITKTSQFFIHVSLFVRSEYPKNLLLNNIEKLSQKGILSGPKIERITIPDVIRRSTFVPMGWASEGIIIPKPIDEPLAFLPPYWFIPLKEIQKSDYAFEPDNVWRNLEYEALLPLHPFRHDLPELLISTKLRNEMNWFPVKKLYTFILGSLPVVVSDVCPYTIDFDWPLLKTNQAALLEAFRCVTAIVDAPVFFFEHTRPLPLLNFVNED